MEEREALAQVRDEIDGIDDRIAELLALRFERTDAVGRLKAAIGEGAISPPRQLQRQAWLAELADRHGLPLPLLLELHRTLSAEVLTRHRAVGAS